MIFNISRPYHPSNIKYKWLESSETSGMQFTYLWLLGAQVPNNGAATSINYPQMYDRDDFSQQHITVTDGDYLILWLDDLDLPPPLTQPDAPLNASSLMTSCSEYIRVYEVDTDQTPHDLAILCGNIDQFDSRSRSIISVFGKDVYIDMNFDLERQEVINFMGRGYRILYTAGYLDCNDDTRIDVQQAGLVASLQFPQNRCNNVTRYYQYIFPDQENYYSFEVTILYFDAEQTCQQPRASYLNTVYGGAGLCGGRASDFHQTTFINKSVNSWLTYVSS